MGIMINPSDPIGSLQAAGLMYETVDVSSETKLNIGGFDMPVSSSHAKRYVWMVPGGTKVEGAFTRESLGKQFIKLFKKELQVNDKTFDDTVYITTPDIGGMGLFLGDETIRMIILEVVAAGGQIAMEKNKIVYEIPGDPSLTDEVKMAQFVAAAAGLS